MKCVKLGEISKIIMGQSPDSSSYNEVGNGVPFFQGKADFGKVNPTVRMYCSSPTKIAESNDILMSVRAPVGDVNVANRQCCIGRGLCAIRGNEGVENKFLYYYLITQKEKLDSKSTGSTFKSINKSVLEELEVPIIDTRNQRKIIGILDKAQELIDKRKEQIEACDELVKSRFVEMFGEPVLNPMNWEKKRLSDECTIITGNTPSRKIDDYYGNYIEWIKSDNITGAGTYLTTARECLSEKGLEVGRSISENSILMTCIAGSIKCIGNVAIANRKVSFNQQINGIEPLNNNVYFMLQQFNLSQSYIQSTINMSLKGILSKGQLSELEFIFPPVEKQNEFGSFFNQVDKLKLEMEQSLKELEDNFNALMQRAFKGELF